MEQFRALDLERLSRAMRTPKIVDLRNIYSKEKAIKAVLKFMSVLERYSTDFKIIAPILLAGGTGMRLWPVSRRVIPNNFQNL